LAKLIDLGYLINFARTCLFFLPNRCYGHRFFASMSQGTATTGDEPPSRVPSLAWSGLAANARKGSRSWRSRGLTDQCSTAAGDRRDARPLRVTQWWATNRIGDHWGWGVAERPSKRPLRKPRSIPEARQGPTDAIGNCPARLECC